MSSRLLGGERLAATSSRAANLFSWAVLFFLFFTIAGALAGGAWKLHKASHAAMWAHVYSLARLDFNIPWAYLNPNNLLSIKQIQQRARIDIHNKYQMKAVDQRLARWRVRQTASIIKAVGYSAAGGAIFGLLAFAGLIRRFGEGARDRDHKRGAKLITPAKLTRLARKTSRGKPRLTVAGIPLPASAEYQHSLFTGSTGSGKSQAVEDRMAQIRKLGDQAIIYDPDRELISHFFKPGDRILNPFDARGEAWDIRREVRAEADCMAVAESLIQPGPGQGQNQFFYETAAQVFAAALASGNDPFGMLEMPTEQLAGQLGGSAAAILGGKSGAEVHKTILSRTRGFGYLERLRVGGEAGFSVRNWVESGNGWLWLTSRDDIHSALSPMLSLAVEVAALQILCRSDGEGEPIHIILDELASLQKLPALQRLLSRGRKRKCAVLLATQSPGQITNIYGREGAQALNDTIGTRLIMRLEDPDSAEFASKLLGDRELMHRTVSQNMGQRRQGSNMNEQLRKERIALPSEIQSLPDLTAYLKLAGGLPPAQVKCKYTSRKKVAEGYIPRDMKWVRPTSEKSPEVPMPSEADIAGAASQPGGETVNDILEDL